MWKTRRRKKVFSEKKKSFPYQKITTLVGYLGAENIIYVSNA
jgi:hypothetical protein